MTIEETAITYLNGVLSVPVYGQEPENPNPGNTGRASFCVLQKTGSGVEKRIRNATLAIQSYAPTLYEAAELDEEVIGAMDAMVELSNVTAVRLNSDYEYTKESTKQPRYQAVFDVYYY